MGSEKGYKGCQARDGINFGENILFTSALASKNSEVEADLKKSHCQPFKRYGQSFLKCLYLCYLNKLSVFKISSIIVPVLILILLFFPSCQSKKSNTTEIVIAGSTSVQPFADKWAELFMEKKPGLVINVQGGGSTAGIMAAKSGTAHIGMSSRELKEEEKSLHETEVARDGIAIIVHPSNPVKDLTIDQVKSIFSGDITNWKTLNGRDEAITVVVREEGSGTRGAFQEMVMGKTRITKRAIVEDSNGTVREIVSRDPNSIGFISLGLVNDKVKAIALNGVFPSEEAILKKEYHLVRPFLFLTKEEPKGLAKEFIDFVLSDEIQSLLPGEGLIPIKKMSQVKINNSPKKED
ncbi:MAG: phosphate ABC transporter substrate-binding protein [Candidatus Aminicenantes bacterium]|nr:phosphate ABC transporter substrate-binding protein [Candidatus Aminicenantes bacterium]